MKKFVSIIAVALFFISNATAQPIANAGTSKTICSSVDTVLGGSPTAQGLNPPFTYSWTPSNRLISNNVANPRTIHLFNTTTFRVVVTDALGDTASSNVTITVIPSPIANAGPDSTLCLGDSIRVGGNPTATGGTPPYSYFWSNFGTSTLANPTFAPVSDIIYAVSVYDANLCLNIDYTNLLVRVCTTQVVNASCFGTCDGSAAVIPTGNHRYLWDNGDTTISRNNLCAGLYSVVVMDSVLNPLDTFSITITQPPLLTVSGNVTNASCPGMNDGDIFITATGGVNPYTYSWSHGSTSRVATSLTAGTYTVTVTDRNGCTVTASYTVSANPLMTVTTTNTHITCGNADTTVLTITNGEPRFYINWGDGSLISDFDSVYSHSYTTGGIYTIQVTDTNGCSVTLTDTILDLLGYSYYVYASGTDANCANDGSAAVSVHGGVAPFSYLWSNGSTTATLTGLSAGIYTLTVTGSDGCTRTGTVRVDSVCYNVISGYMFVDSNNNCIRDTGEIIIANRSVTARDGNNSYYGYTDASGYYEINVATPGNFTLTLYHGWGNQCQAVNVCGPQIISFTGVGDTAVVNFGFSNSSGFDLALHPGWRAANPGFPKDYWVLYHQTSTPIYTGPATITFLYDTILVYQSSNNGGVHNAAAHTITWTVSSVPYPSWDWGTVPRASFTVPANTPIGYQLRQEFIITPTSGDCDMSDNHLLVIEPVTGSRDPNEKHVEPAGDIFEEDSVLTYTIHFQNTGNDTTWFVILKDTLSPHLNAATVQNLASSHPYTSFDISDHGILTWLFNPIFLVDSATNEPASKGFVMFKVKKKSNLPLTTAISNTAHIYFDYNEAVVTNTVTNTLTEPNFVFTVRSDENILVSAMPNPFTQQTQIVVQGINSAFDFELFDVTGKVIRKISSVTENRFELQREDMSAGVYFYRITTTQKQRAFGRVVVE